MRRTPRPRSRWPPRSASAPTWTSRTSPSSAATPPRRAPAPRWRWMPWPGSSSARATSTPWRARACPSPRTPRWPSSITGSGTPFIQVQRALGRFETEVLRVALTIDRDQRVGVKNVGGITLMNIHAPGRPACRPDGGDGRVSATPLAPPRESMMPTERTRADRVAGLRARLVPSRDDLVDLGFTALLVGLALWGFRTVFFGWEWILAAVGGLLLGLLVAHLVTAFRLPSVVTHARSRRGIPAPRRAARGPRPPRARGVPERAHLPRPRRRPRCTAGSGCSPCSRRSTPRSPCWPCRSIVGLVAAAVTYTVARRRSHGYAVVVPPLARPRPDHRARHPRARLAARPGRRLRAGRDRLDDRAQHPLARAPAERRRSRRPRGDRHRPAGAGRGRRPARRAAPAGHRRRPAPGGAHRGRAAVRHRAVPEPAGRASASTPSPTTPSSTTPS